MGRDNQLRIPEPLRHDVEEVFKLTDPFCAEHLDAEYSELVRKLVSKLARKRPSPLEVEAETRSRSLIPDHLGAAGKGGGGRASHGERQ